ncbi:MAG: dTMP kinase [Candidatus Nanohalobium sp.]
MKEHDYPGRFIVIEGADGAGTTTQAEKLADKHGFYLTEEPTENKVGEKVKQMISEDDYQPSSVALGFASDRMVHIDEEIKIKLREGKTVICDRYYHSSLVYQPTMGLEFEWVKKLNRFALKPDLTFILDIEPDLGMKRIHQREEGKDENIFEDLDFQEKVVLKYRKLDEKLDEDIEIIDSTQSKEKVHQNIEEALEKNFENINI